MGLRYRVHSRPITSLQRTADLVFPRQRIAVFIDGCFWHGCPEHHRQPAANADYWIAKIGRNRSRDLATDAALEEHGWKSLRFWSHENPQDVAELIRDAVRDPSRSSTEREKGTT